jgi:hypothetical protein
MTNMKSLFTWPVSSQANYLVRVCEATDHGSAKDIKCFFYSFFLTINLFILSSLCVFSQVKKTAAKVLQSPAAPTAATAAQPLSISASEMFNAINTEYVIRPVMVNNKAPLEIVYSPLLVFFDFTRIKSEANYMIDDLTQKRQAINPFIGQLANMRYRNHNEFLPIDGAFNVTFIKPNLSINPANLTSVPTIKVTGQLKYRISK